MLFRRPRFPERKRLPTRCFPCLLYTSSEEVNSAIDREVHRLIDEGYKRAESILTEHMDKLHALAALLLEREKLDADEFTAFMATGAVPEKPAPEPPQPSPEPAPTEPGEEENGAEAPQEAQPNGTCLLYTSRCV